MSPVPGLSFVGSDFYRSTILQESEDIEAGPQSFAPLTLFDQDRAIWRRLVAVPSEVVIVASSCGYEGSSSPAWRRID